MKKIFKNREIEIINKCKHFLFMTLLLLFLMLPIFYISSFFNNVFLYYIITIGFMCLILVTLIEFKYIDDKYFKSDKKCKPL